MSERDPWNISEGWWGTDGNWHQVDPEVRRALAAASGAAAHPDGPPRPPVWFVRAGAAESLWSPAVVTLEGGEQLGVATSLPPDLPLGAHELRPDDGGPATQLFVVPTRAPNPRRTWGWSTQLYATRSGASWGQGDLGDLAALAEWTAAAGGGLLAHNPLGAPLPIAAQQPSPYYASTRRFWSPSYLRIETVRGASSSDATTSALALEGRALNRSRHIDRDEIWRLKLVALESIWAQVGSSDAVRARLESAAADDELTRYCEFCALAEHHGTGWQLWPAALQRPDGDAVARFAAAHAERIAFWRWVQLELDEQLRLASHAGAPLMADLPVGFDPAGFDAWVDQDLLALGCRIGAPPDEFNSLGQDWGLPPYVPWKLRAAGYRPWLDTLRRVLRHAGALRIDHVMGLFRLYWIPGGAPPGSGGYVAQYGSELLDLAVMEAVRAGTPLIGEDLGTVEPAVRDSLSQRNVFGYRIGWFTEDPPAAWPRETLAALSTHDLPTVAGLLTGEDARGRRAAGLPDDPDGDELLRARLASLAGDLDGRAISDVTRSAHDALAAAGSDIVLATLEDALGVRERPNLPGTVDEHPNWRLALPVPLEDLDAAGTAEIAASLREVRGERRAAR